MECRHLEYGIDALLLAVASGFELSLRHGFGLDSSSSRGRSWGSAFVVVVRY